MKNFKELVTRLQGAKTVKRVAVVAADDAHTLEALLMARKDGVVEPVLVGDATKITECLVSLGAADAKLKIVDAADHEDAARKAVALIHAGEADFLMKGRLETATLMKVIVNRESGMRTDRIMSHVAFLEIPSYHKILAVTDVAMLTYPDLSQKKQAIENAVGALRKMGIDQPKVAVMSAAEEVNPKLPESADALELKMMNQKGELTGCVVEGPISYDLAMSKEAAEVKRYS
ncbi:MAG: phosphate acyltransferase, partial [Treponemataceae bacterium]